MSFLLDTNVIIWLTSEPNRVPETVRNILREDDNPRFVSVVSGWEYGQKRLLCSAELPHPFERLIASISVHRLDLSFAVHGYAESLPLIHRDPFDRMLIAQALYHDLTIVTSDKAIRRYPVKTLW